MKNLRTFGKSGEMLTFLFYLLVLSIWKSCWLLQLLAWLTAWQIMYLRDTYLASVECQRKWWIDCIHLADGKLFPDQQTEFSRFTAFLVSCCPVLTDTNEIIHVTSVTIPLLRKPGSFNNQTNNICISCLCKNVSKYNNIWCKYFRIYKTY